MYGSVAKLQVKPGSMDALMSWGDSRDASTIPGYISQYVFQTDANSNVLFLVVIFADKASYEANSRTPLQDERYAEMRTMLSADPEWHDGEVIYSHEAVAHGL
jgi:quinol monooxygenase YgiN